MRQWIDRWLFQLRDAEVGEVLLNQRRVFILPTRAGLGFSVLLLVLFIGSVNYSLGMGFALTFLLAACGLITLHMTFRNLAYLSLAAARAPAVHAGEMARFEVRLLNRSRHDRFALAIGFMDAAPNEHSVPAQDVDVPAESEATVTLSTPARHRGWLPAPRVRLDTRFPLGLLRAWSYWQPDAKVLVYPRPEDDPPPLPRAHEGREESNGPAGEEDFAGVRAYQAGDPLRRLAWRQIARLGNDVTTPLLTKHFEGGLAGTIVLDIAALPVYLDVEARLSRLARWVLEAEARGLPYAMRLGVTQFDAALGPTHRRACMRALALYGLA